MKAYPFIESPDPSEIREDIEADPIAFLKKKLGGRERYGFGMQEIMKHGAYREMGYAYDLRPYLVNYVYKQYGMWYEAYALNRANLRKLVGGTITKIVEVK